MNPTLPAVNMQWRLTAAFPLLEFTIILRVIQKHQETFCSGGMLCI